MINNARPLESKEHADGSGVSLAPVLRVFVLGPFQVLRPGEDRSIVARTRDKSWTLFKYLVIHRGTAVATDEILDLFWPDRADEDGTGPLRSTLTRLKARLEPGRAAYLPSRYIAYSRDSCALDPEAAIWVDCEEFERLCQAARQEEQRRPEQAVHLYLQALRLYRGDLLADEPYADWAVLPREYYHRLYVVGVKRAATMLTSLKDLVQTQAVLQRALVIEPYDEELHLQLMKIWLAQGQCKAVIQHYGKVTRLLYQELGVAPTAQLTELYQRAKQGAATDLGVCRSTPKMRTEAHRQTAIPAVRSEPEWVPSPQETAGRRYGLGAFTCDPATFTQLVQLERRRLARQSTASTVLLLSVVESAGRSGEPVVDKGDRGDGAGGGDGRPQPVRRLLSLCQECLRSCDVLSLRRSGRLGVLCPDTPVSGARVAAARIKQAWAAACPQAKLRIRIVPVQPEGGLRQRSRAEDRTGVR
ncbi:MAG: hypothetical protein IMX01_04820 [Limnochordaceae bacterium]|nr:hypothetical protein [Limnochordaceae bacterium]